MDSGNVLIAIVNTNETWEEHFVSRGWESPQDQIDAGYEYYIQPTLESGFYEEIIDFGIVYSNVIVNVDFSQTVVFGGVVVTTKISTSEDGVTYTTAVVGSSLYVASLRYVKVRLEFLASE